MKSKARQADYLNSIINRQLTGTEFTKEHSPASSSIQSNNLIYHSNINPPTHSTKKKAYKNKIMHSPDERNVQISSARASYQTSKGTINDQINSLHKKLKNLQERYLMMNTPRKPSKRSQKKTLKRTQFNTKTNSLIQSNKKISQTIRKIKDTTDCNIQTTRGSVRDKSLQYEKRKRNSLYSRDMIEGPLLDPSKSVVRSPDKERSKIKLETSRPISKCQSSKTRKDNIQKQVQFLKQRIAQHRLLEERQKEMIMQNQRLVQALQRSESICETQIKMLNTYKSEINQLKDTFSKINL